MEHLNHQSTHLPTLFLIRLFSKRMHCLSCNKPSSVHGPGPCLCFDCSLATRLFLLMEPLRPGAEQPLGAFHFCFCLQFLYSSHAFTKKNKKQITAHVLMHQKLAILQGGKTSGKGKMRGGGNKKKTWSNFKYARAGEMWFRVRGREREW